MDRCNYFKISEYSCSKYVLLYNQFFEATVCSQPFHHVRVLIQASLLRILLLHQQSWIAASHPSGEAIAGFSFPSWKTKQLPDTTTIILPDQDFWVFTSRWVQGAWPSQWPCLRPLMEGQALGISCAPSVCARYNTHTHTKRHTLKFLAPLSLVSLSASHSPEWQLLNCDKWAVSGQPPYLGDWLNDLSITQPLLYSPSTDKVTHAATEPICQDQCHRRCH